VSLHCNYEGRACSLGELAWYTNSQAIIEQCGFGDTVELSVDKNRVIIAPDRLPRQGWDEVFRAAGSGQTGEVPLADLPPNEFDSQEWEW